jgi:hypothetical protein
MKPRTSSKTFFRYFLAHQDARQEAWLESLARQGWHLASPGWVAFGFVRGESRRDRYRLDYQRLDHERRAEYLGLYRDAGWDFVGESFNRYYFRSSQDSMSPEIFSDAESRNDRIRRELRIIVLLFGINAWNTIWMTLMLLRRPIPSPGTLASVWGWIEAGALAVALTAAGLLGYCALRLFQALRTRA